MITTEFWQALVDSLTSGQAAFLALVVDSRSGSPGTAGAAMLVRADGTQMGTVGGGIMEYNLLAVAGEAIGTGTFASRLEVLWHRRDAPGKPSGMICSGNQTNLYHLCHPSRDLEIFRRVLNASRFAGSEALVFTAEGLELGVAGDTAPLVVVDPEAWEVRLRIAMYRRIAIIGGGHCGRALSHTMRRLHYRVAVLDTRPDASLFMGNADAHDRILLDDYQAAGDAIDEPGDTSVVVMTTDYPSDVRALAGLLPLPFPFIGVMGSRAKLQRIGSDLRQLGFTDEQVSRLRAPVGLPIGSHTPEEIAISIAAQFIKESSCRS